MGAELKNRIDKGRDRGMKLNGAQFATYLGCLEGNWNYYREPIGGVSVTKPINERDVKEGEKLVTSQPENRKTIIIQKIFVKEKKRAKY